MAQGETWSTYSWAQSGDPAMDGWRWALDVTEDGPNGRWTLTKSAKELPFPISLGDRGCTGEGKPHRTGIDPGQKEQSPLFPFYFCYATVIVPFIICRKWLRYGLTRKIESQQVVDSRQSRWEGVYYLLGIKLNKVLCILPWFGILWTDHKENNQNSLIRDQLIKIYPICML